MTTRNITKQFESLRAKAHASHASINVSSYHPEGGKSSLLGGQSDDSNNTTINVGDTDLEGLMMHNPPKWVDIVDTVKTDMERIDQSTQELEQAYSQRLKVTFGNEAEERQREDLIENITHQTTTLIKGIESKIKSIAFCDDNINTAAELSINEKNVRLNVMRNLGSTLQLKSKAFKQQQRDYLTKLQKQQNIGNDLFADMSSTGNDASKDMQDGDVGMILDLALEQGLTDEQQSQLDEIQMRADDREQEIITLVQNINELASLFQELNVLVIEQGTILDRIDYSVEQTLVNVQQGHIELDKAEKMSKSNWLLKFMLILLIVILLEVVAVIVKWKLKSKFK